MAIDPVFDAARDGMTYERMRLDAAARNIAAANTPIAPGQSPTLWQVGASPDFARHLGDAAPALGEREAPVREVHDPSHPYADKDGMVRYPAVDLVHEMTTLMTASRGYEANVRSFNFLRGMLMRALEIGAK